jgi:hypothetical protein
MEPATPSAAITDDIDLSQYKSYFDQRAFHASKVADDVRAIALGKPLDWRIDNPETETSLLKVADVAQQHGIWQVLLPAVSAMNAACCEPTELTQQRAVGDIFVHYDLDADGLILPRQTCFFVAAADCPTVIFKDYRRGNVVAAHAARDSLVDRSRVLGYGSSREHESVVYAALRMLCDQLTRPHDIHIRICYGVAKRFFHPIDHAQHGHFNERLLRELCTIDGRTGTHSLRDWNTGDISLPELIRAQAISHGVPAHNIQWLTPDTADPQFAEDFWSHSRGDRERNGIFIIRE